MTATVDDARPAVPDAEQPELRSSPLGGPLAAVGAVLAALGVVLPWSTLSGDHANAALGHLQPAGVRPPVLLLSIVILALAVVNRLYPGSHEAVGVAIALCALGILASWVLRVPGIVEWWQSRPAGADAPVSGSLTLAVFLTPVGALLSAVGGILVVPGRVRIR